MGWDGGGGGRECDAMAWDGTRRDGIGWDAMELGRGRGGVGSLGKTR